MSGPLLHPASRLSVIACPWAGWVIAFALVTSWAAPAPGQAPTVTVELAPKKLQFSATGTEFEILAIVRNAGDAELKNAHFLKTVEPGAALEPVTASLGNVPAKSDQVWALRIRRLPADPPPATISAVFEYEQGQVKDAGVRKVVAASLELVRPEIETTDPLVATEVRTNFEYLHAGDNGTIDLILTNKSTATVWAAVEVRWPSNDSLKSAGDCPGGVQLLPKSTGFVRIPVKAERRVRSGKETVEFVVRVAWGSGEGHQTRTTVASTQITLDVLAEAAVLKFFGGVPLLLFLPGFLTLLTWGLLWQVGLFKTRYDTAKFPLEPATLNFYLVAVLLSFAFLGFHLLLGFDYLTVYGFLDLVILYVLSVVVYGGLLYALVMGVWWTIKRKKIPTMSDDPVAGLTRLGALGLNLYRPGLERGAADPKLVFLLERPVSETERPTTWVAPPIKLAWKVGADHAVRKRIEPQLNRLIGQAADADASEAARLVREAIQDPSIAYVAWILSGGLTAPAELQTKDAVPSKSPQLILQIFEE